MNIRKPVDYSTMYAELDSLMTAGLPQMELYCGIGRTISEMPEKGAAVIAAEYLQAGYPDAYGFSPRNTRRMREFYRAYENSPALLHEAMKIGWTQNVVILEAKLTIQERAWYVRAAHRFGWTKQALATQIADRAHESVLLDTPEESCYTEAEITSLEERDDEDIICVSWQHLPQPHGGICDEGHGVESRIGERDLNILRRHQHRGTGQTCLFSGAPPFERVRDRLRGQNRPPDDPRRLWCLRPADRYGRGKSAQYAMTLRRISRGQDTPPIGICRSPGGSCGSMVHTGLRDNLAGYE